MSRHLSGVLALVILAVSAIAGGCGMDEAQQRHDRYADTLERVDARLVEITAPGVVHRTSEAGREAEAIAAVGQQVAAAALQVADAATKAAAAADEAAETAATLPEQVEAIGKAVGPLAAAVGTIATGNPEAGAAVQLGVETIAAAVVGVLGAFQWGRSTTKQAWAAADAAWDEASKSK